MTNQQAPKLPEPSIGSLDDPTPLISPHFASIVTTPVLVVLPVWSQQFDPPLLQSFPQRIGVVTGIGDHAFRFFSWAAPGPRDADFCQCGFRERNLCRGGTFQKNSQGNTFAVYQYHPLRSLAPLGFPDRKAPFFAGAKLPSKKLSSQRSRPFSSSAPSSVRQASSQIPFSCQHCSRRQQVEGEGNSSGRNRHAAPVCKIQRIPSRQARFGAGGRPRFLGSLLRS